MNPLKGTYYCKLDSKGRISLPAALRKQLPPECNDVFIIKKGFEGCLELYPLNVWNSMLDDMSKQNLFDPRMRLFERKYKQDAIEITLDSASRLLLQKHLLSLAGITDEAMIFCRGKLIEIWNQDLYNKSLEQLTEEEYNEMAMKYLGNALSNI
ncbi:MAG: division/cell wall cluster transcriptional repressor MraZ [Bacteroidetes bacterium]|nr:division/cell wall cluster transcriptional repressor MraZ [Bacteroidota bacterium]